MKVKASRMGILCLMLFTVISCADRPTKEQIDEARQLTPVCVSDKQCQVEWEAATAWVSGHCGMKIQNASDNLIQTYNSPEASTQLACKVNKIPAPGGRYGIVATVGCSNFIRCDVPPIDAIEDFDNTVTAAGAQYAPIVIGAKFAEVDQSGAIVSASSESYGLKIEDIIANSKAANSGLKVGDIITSMNGARIYTQSEWTETILKMHAGDLLNIGLYRSSQQMQLTIRL